MNYNRLPVVSIVGRPNVGKSTLFNRLLKRKLAITHETSGVTRDRLYHPAEWAGSQFLLADTGGLSTEDAENYSRQIREQVDVAALEADVILLVVDAETGLMDEDRSALRHLRRLRKKIVLVANKCDMAPSEEKKREFQSLGLGEPEWVSGLHGTGVGDLLDVITGRLPEELPGAGVVPAVRIAVLGRPNVGKSTFVNAVLGESRMITDNRPGTTRDSVDSYFTYHERPFCIVDTAGLRRRARVKEALEYYAGLRAGRAIERCDVVLILVDVQEGFDLQDLKIFESAVRGGKGVILGINKWDLSEKTPTLFDRAVEAMVLRNPKIDHFPVISLSAKTGLRVSKVLDLAESVAKNLEADISSEALDEFLKETLEHYHPPAYRGRHVQLLAMAQTGARPLRFDIETNHPDGIPISYQRYLEKRFYEHFKELSGCPAWFNFVKAGKRAEVVVS